MGKAYVGSLWRLFRKKCRGTYNFTEKNAVFLRKERKVPAFPSLWLGKGGVRAYESHSGRSAWLFSPWKEKGRWYSGFEYKGIGNDGKKIRRFANTAWGGVYRKWALAEHRFSKTAFDAGIFCQRPIAVYEYGRFYGKDLAVLVRTFTSPIRLSDFILEKRFFNAYLRVRGETEREYCDSLSSTLGGNVRKLFDLGLYHGSMELNNITSEGELADFEPTYGGTWEGLRRTRDAHFRHIALWRVLDAGRKLFPERKKEFQEGFARSFFGRAMELSSSNAAKEMAEKYCGVRVRERKAGKKDSRMQSAIRLLESAKKQTGDRRQLRYLDFVLNSLK